MNRYGDKLLRVTADLKHDNHEHVFAAHALLSRINIIFRKADEYTWTWYAFERIALRILQKH